MAQQGMINIAGASEGRIAPIIANLRKDKKGQSLIVVSTLNRAKRLASDLSFFSEEKIYILPPEEESLIQFEARSNDDLLKRMSVLGAKNAWSLRRSLERSRSCRRERSLQKT